MTGRDPRKSDSARPGDGVENLKQELEETRLLLIDSENEVRRLQAELNRLKSSAGSRLVTRLQDRARRMAPFGTRRQRAIHNVAQGVAVLVEEGPPALARQIQRRRREGLTGTGYADTTRGRHEQYRAWLRAHEPDAAGLARLRAVNRSWSNQPVISIVMPVHDPKRVWLREAVDSVLAQVYSNWELCIADDASVEPYVREMLETAARTEPRIKLVFREKGGGIAAASNSALAIASGDYVGFLDHDDRLRPHALHAVVAYLQNHPSADLIYSDEDKILASGQYGDPFFKPDWSPDMLLAWNYFTHFVVVRRQLIERIGGFREGFEGSQDHDLLLRATESSDAVGHVADVLYAWRVVPGSVALSSDFKPLAREAGRRAVQDALRRRGAEARVDSGTHPGLYHVRYAIAGQPSVGIIIPTRDKVNLLRACISSVERLTTYPRYSITIVNNGSRNPQTLAYLGSTEHRVLDYDAPFNYAAIINFAVRSIEADHLLLLNNDVTVLTPGWIEALLEQSQRSPIGAVGGRLVYTDGHVQHEGIVLGGLHPAANAEMGWPVVREVSAVTGACMMTRREVFEEVNGFDESLAEAFNDVDYCLRVRGRGYRVIYTPLAELCHREGGTRGVRTPERDLQRFVARWGDSDVIEEPYLNHNVLWPRPLQLRVD